MRNRHRALVGALLTIAMGAAPGAAGTGGSPLPSAVPSVAVAPSPSGGAPGATSSPAASPVLLGGGPRWSRVVDHDVRRIGVLDHAVTLGAEAIVLATVVDRHGQARVRVLATGDGATWTRRGTLPMGGTIADLLADGTTLYAVGWDGQATIWRSDDAGRTWRTPTDAGPFAGDADGQSGTSESATVAAITRGPAGLLAVGDATDPDALAHRGAVWRSADGLTWERSAAAASLPPFTAVAADASSYVAVGWPVGSATTPVGGRRQVLRWSTDGATWTDATVPIAADETVQGVVAVPTQGFLAWGAHVPGSPAGAIAWTSMDGHVWTRRPDDPALAGVALAVVRSLEGGALTMAVGGMPDGAYAIPWLGDAWRRDAIASRAALCVRDVVSVRAILVAVGGTCGGPRPHGRAWTSPLEP